MPKVEDKRADIAGYRTVGSAAAFGFEQPQLTRHVLGLPRHVSPIAER